MSKKGSEKAPVETGLRGNAEACSWRAGRFSELLVEIDQTGKILESCTTKFLKTNRDLADLRSIIDLTSEHLGVLGTDRVLLGEDFEGGAPEYLEHKRAKLREVLLRRRSIAAASGAWNRCLPVSFLRRIV